MRGVAVALVLFLFILLSVHEAVLQAAGDFLAVEDPLHRADAIIAISGDGQERVRAASELLRRGLGRWLILSGGPGGGSGSARQLLDYAYEVGVPDDRILVDDGATSTTGNARGSADLMRRKGLRSAILVTSPYHMRRSAVIFRGLLPTPGTDGQRLSRAGQLLSSPGVVAPGAGPRTGDSRVREVIRLSDRSTLTSRRRGKTLPARPSRYIFRSIDGLGGIPL